MNLDKGNEKLTKTRETVEPSADDAEAMAGLMRETLPEFWGEETGEKIRESMEKTFWLVAKDGDEIVSLGEEEALDNVRDAVRLHSPGVAELLEDDTADAFFNRLKKTVREAKKAGRNRTFIDEGDGPKSVDPPEYNVSSNVIPVR